MKKAVFILSVAAFAFSFASCEKNYNCECTDNTGYVWSKSTLHTTKSKAEKECTANSTGSTITCTIK